MSHIAEIQDISSSYPVFLSFQINFRKSKNLEWFVSRLKSKWPGRPSSARQLCFWPYNCPWSPICLGTPNICWTIYIRFSYFRFQKSSSTTSGKKRQRPSSSHKKGAISTKVSFLENYFKVKIRTEQKSCILFDVKAIYEIWNCTWQDIGKSL